MADPRSATERMAKARRGAERVAAMLARKLGYELRRHNFYLPFPDVPRLPEALWSGPQPHPGVDLRLEAASELLAQLRPYAGEFAALNFPIANGTYEHGDADSLFAMLRHLAPRRVIELGSGASTHVIAHARAASAEGFRFDSYDPYPGWHALGAPAGVAVHPVATEQIAPGLVAELEPGDVLFVDTTHTVRTGGDVTHLMLELLPALAPGVYVHLHDVFLPYEYPRGWVVRLYRAWAEQYLLQAFLAFNSSFEVVLPLHALWRQRPALVHEALPTTRLVTGEGPGAFWIRRSA